MTISLVSSSFAEANGNSLEVNAPSGISAGNLLVAFWLSRGSESDGNMTLPSGWTQVAFDGGQNPSCKVAYKVATGSEPSTYTFGLSTSRRTGCAIGQFADVDTTSGPGDATPTTAAGSSVTTLTIGAVTTATDAAWLLWGAGTAPGVGFYDITLPSGFSTIQNNNGSHVSLGFGYKEQASAGSSGDQSGSTQSSVIGWAGAMWAIKPAATAAASLVFRRKHSALVRM